MGARKRPIEELAAVLFVTMVGTERDERSPMVGWSSGTLFCFVVLCCVSFNHTDDNGIA